MYIIRSLNLMMTKKHVKVGQKKSQTIPRAPGFQKRVFSDVFFGKLFNQNRLSYESEISQVLDNRSTGMLN